MLLSALAALGSYSRGGLLAIAAMGLFMWLKSERKMVLGALLGAVTPLLLAFMPERWAERMDTINTYQEDVSALGRLNAWRMAWNLARDRFPGGGFDVSDASIFARYAPNPMDVHAAHSIYFQALGEHGFVGLLIYLALGIATWRTATAIIRRTRGRPELRWAHGLATMSQASLIGFAVGGAFLSLLYFDMPYYLMAALIATRIIVEQQAPAPTLRRAKPRAAIAEQP
jgi:probable O-glycosylation ligase (exosortase A-associated)